MDKKVVLVTGASRGIGKAIAIAFAKEGYYVIIHYKGSKDKALETLSEIHSLNQEGVLMQASLEDETSVNKALLEITKTVDTIDVLVNNAAIKKDAPIIDMSLKMFEEIMKVNVTGAWLMTKAVLPYMIKQKSGSIINISSSVGQYGRENQTNYAGSKGAINAITKSLAKELGVYQIRVNAIAPGLIETDMTRNIDQNIKTSYQNQIPLKHLGSPVDIANAAVFLASTKARFINGQIIPVNGGIN